MSKGLRKGLYAIAAIATTLALTPAVAGAATITVSTTTDENGGATPLCSVREAVNAAVGNLDGDGCDTGVEVIGAYGTATPDEIVLPSSTTYDLTVGEIPIAANGPIVIRSDNPAVRRNISMADLGGAAENRAFHLTNASSDVTFKSLSITNADDVVTGGGGVIWGQLDGNKLTLDNVALNASKVGVNAVNGGVIRIDGAASTLTITDSVITGGEVSQQGGGIFASAMTTPVTITRSSIVSNQVTTTGATSVQGGGISTGAPLTITGSEIIDNIARADDVTSLNAVGGGIFQQPGVSAPVTIKRSLLSGNQAISDNSIAGVVQEFGGAIYKDGDGALTVANSTIAGNTAGNAATDQAQGGGIYTVAGFGTPISFVTFSGNDAANPAGADHIYRNGGDPVVLTASILPIASAGVTTNACEGTMITSGGFNVTDSDPVADPQCNFGMTDTTTGVTGLAGALAANGGPAIGGSSALPMRTLAISSASSAFDEVPTANCTLAEGVDQRGVGRPISAACDAGAFEAACVTPSTLPGCPALPASAPPPAGPTGLRAAALKKCKKKKSKKSRKKCKKRALKLPV